MINRSQVIHWFNGAPTARSAGCFTNFPWKYYLSAVDKVWLWKGID